MHINIGLLLQWSARIKYLSDAANKCYSILGLSVPVIITANNSNPTNVLEQYFARSFPKNFPNLNLSDKSKIINASEFSKGLDAIKDSKGFQGIKKKLLNPNTNAEEFFALLLEVNVGKEALSRGCIIRYLDEEAGQTPDIEVSKDGLKEYFECKSLINFTDLNITKTIRRAINRGNKKFRSLSTNGVVVIDTCNSLLNGHTTNLDNLSKVFQKYINENASHIKGLVFIVRHIEWKEDGSIMCRNLIKSINKKGEKIDIKFRDEEEIQIKNPGAFTNLNFG